MILAKLRGPSAIQLVFLYGLHTRPEGRVQYIQAILTLVWVVANGTLKICCHAATIRMPQSHEFEDGCGNFLDRRTRSNVSQRIPGLLAYCCFRCLRQGDE